MKTFIVDSFTQQPFKGNPAGVCLTEQELTPEIMLNIAKELNLSETAFVQKNTTDRTYTIRFFSPKVEIPLCGHATLAAGKIITTLEKINKVSFTNIQNIVLTITTHDQGLTMEFPLYDTEPAPISEEMKNALGIDNIIYSAYNKEVNAFMIEIGSTQELAGLAPDFNTLITTHDSISGVCITAKSADGDFDFHCRYFWPWSGSNEDPVTGAIHTFLTKYWSGKLGKKKLRSLQASARTGYMDLQITDQNTLLITSNAVIMLEGSLRSGI